MPGPLLIGPLGPLELAIIVGVIVLLFGVGRISRIGGDLGSSIKEFRRAVREDSEEEGATEEAQAEVQPEQAAPQQPVQQAAPQQPVQQAAPPAQQAAPPAAPPAEAPRSDSGTRNVF